MKICPICETENKPQATHCEVCGERLAPPAPGETLTPEESVTASLPTHSAPEIEATPETSATPETPPKKPISDADFEAAFVELKERVSAMPADDPAIAATPETAPTPRPLTPAPPKARPVAPTPPPPRPVAKRETAPPPRIISSGIPNARVVIYQNKEPTHIHPIVNDETLIGRYDPLSGAYPELDLGEFDPDGATSRKHAYIYRTGQSFTLYPVSNGGTQLNDEMVQMGQRKALKDGDVIILAASLAMKFHIDDE
jgi:hypothetical protein